MNFDPIKPCETISGKEVKIYHAGSSFIHGAYRCGNKWYIYEWSIDGICPKKDLCLKNIPRKRKVKAWFMEDASGKIAVSMFDVSVYTPNSKLFAIKEIEITEGEGLK